MKASPTNGLAYKKKFDDIFPKLAEEYDLTLIPDRKFYWIKK